MLAEVNSLLGKIEAVVTSAAERRGLAVVPTWQWGPVGRELASRLGPLGRRIQESGARLEVSTAELDTLLRALWDLVSRREADEMADVARAAILGVAAQFRGLDRLENSVSTLLGTIARAETRSTALRLAAVHLRTGIASLRSSVATMRSWADIPSTS